MTSLLDGIFAFFDGIGAWFANYHVHATISDLQGISDPDGLAAYWAATPVDIQADPGVAAAYKDAQARIKRAGGGGFFGSLATDVVQGFDALEADLGKAIADLLSANLGGVKAGIGTAIAAALDPVLLMMITALEGAGKKTTPDLQAQLKGVLVPIIQMGLTLEIASDLAEFAMPTKTLGTGGIGHFIHDTIGFDALCNAYTGPVRESLIEIPTRYSIMRLIQPWNVRPGEAVKMVYWGLMTPDQYGDVLRYTGIQESQIANLEATIWRELTMRDVQRMTTVAMPDTTWLTTQVKKMGFSPDDVPIIIGTLKQRAVQSDVGNIRTQQRTAYKDGYMSQAEYLAALASRGITSTDAQPFLAGVAAENQYTINKDLQNGYETLFLDGRSTEDQLRAAYATLNLQQAVIDARVAYLTTKKLGKLKSSSTGKVLTRADIEKQYTDGTITKQAAAAALDTGGYSADDAMAIMDLVDQDLLNKVNAEWIRALEKRTVDGRMTVQDLQAAYTQYGKSEDYAAARAAYINELVQGKEKTVVSSDTTTSA